MSTQATTDLVRELRQLDANEKDELKARAAKIMLGASVIRVFKKDTKRAWSSA